MIRRGTLFMAAALSIFRISGIAAESPYRIRPDRQPLLVARVKDGHKLSELLAAAPIAALGLNQRDYQGGVPGLGIDIRSLRGILDGLAETGAINLWYCLLPAENSIAKLAAGIGWRWPSGFTEDAATDWLANYGFPPDGPGMDFFVQPGRGMFFTMSESRAAIKSFPGGEPIKRTDHDDWHEDLQAFLAAPTDAFGLCGNPRPLLGMAALASGLDIRSALARLNMSIPRSVLLQFNVDNGQVVVQFALNGLFLNPPTRPGASPVMDLPLPRSAGPFMRLTLTAPSALFRALGLDTIPLHLANIDINALVPRLACLDIWMDEEGKPHWSLVCLIGDKTSFSKHFRRVLTWADLLVERFGFLADVSPPPSRSGTESYVVELQGFPIAFEVSAVSTEESEKIFLIAAERPEDYPIAQNIEIGSGRREPFLSWRIGLDDDTRLAIARSFIHLTSKYGLPQVKSTALAEALPILEDGCLTVEGDSLTASSPQGMAIWLIPLLMDLVRNAGY